MTVFGISVAPHAGAWIETEKECLVMSTNNRRRFQPRVDSCEIRALCDGDPGVNVAVGLPPEQEGASFGGLLGDSGTEIVDDGMVDLSGYSGGGIETPTDPPSPEGNPINYEALLASLGGPTQISPYDPYS